MKPRQALALAAVVLCCAALPVHAADPAPETERVQVADPFLEMHTGPGRGYPVHHVAARHEFVTIELRRTDWYRVRTDDGKVGWVPRRQLEATLTTAGVRKTFRDIALDDYLGRRVELGAAWGRFKKEPMLKVWTAYRFADALSAEATIGQVQGLFSGTDFWHLGMNVEPWSDQRLSPSFGIGVGKFRNIPNQSLVDAVRTDANLAQASLGLRWYITERFVARADLTLYSAFVSEQRSLEYRAITAGIAFFF